MDYGILHVDDDLELHLYGTPGQRRFSFMWDVLAVGAVGVIFLVDGSDVGSVDEMKYIYHHFRDRLHAPAIVGVPKQDLNGSISAEEVGAHLQADNIPIIGCDPRNKEDSKMLVLSLLELIMEEQSDETLEESDYF
jgi:signal recognition particle receptor subunit beta